MYICRSSESLVLGAPSNNRLQRTVIGQRAAAEPDR